MNFRFDVANSVYQIIEQREESEKKRGKKGKNRWTWFLYISDGREELEGSMGESKMAVWSCKEKKGEEKSVWESVDVRQKRSGYERERGNYILIGIRGKDK